MPLQMQPLSAVLAAASQVMSDTVHSLATPDNVHPNAAADLSPGGLCIAITSGPLVAWTCSSPADRFRSASSVHFCYIVDCEPIIEQL